MTEHVNRHLSVDDRRVELVDPCRIGRLIEWPVGYDGFHLTAPRGSSWRRATADG